jgi:Arc/MetJ-type ribon-helix-helix transcriptional regulator
MRKILNISLPKSMADAVKQEVKQGGFASASEFIRHLIRLYNTEKLAGELNREIELIKKGKIKLKELKSLKDLM